MIKRNENVNIKESIVLKIKRELSAPLKKV